MHETLALSARGKGTWFETFALLAMRGVEELETLGNSVRGAGKWP